MFLQPTCSFVAIWGKTETPLISQHFRLSETFAPVHRISWCALQTAAETETEFYDSPGSHIPIFPLLCIFCFFTTGWQLHFFSTSLILHIHQICLFLPVVIPIWRVTLTDPGWPRVTQGDPRWPRVTQGDPAGWPSVPQGDPGWPPMAGQPDNKETAVTGHRPLL